MLNNKMIVYEINGIETIINAFNHKYDNNQNIINYFE